MRSPAPNAEQGRVSAAQCDDVRVRELRTA